jgi:hypothetical protein
VLIRLVSELSANLFKDLAGWPIGCIRTAVFTASTISPMIAQSWPLKLPSGFFSIVSLTSGPISLAQTTSKVKVC